VPVGWSLFATDFRVARYSSAIRYSTTNNRSTASLARIVFLHVLAVVALAVREADESLLQDGVLLVPDGQRKAEVLLVIGNTSDAVLAPAVGARAGLIVAEKFQASPPSQYSSGTVPHWRSLRYGPHFFQGFCLYEFLEALVFRDSTAYTSCLKYSFARYCT